MSFLNHNQSVYQVWPVAHGYKVMPIDGITDKIGRLATTIYGCRTKKEAVRKAAQQFQCLLQRYH